MSNRTRDCIGEVKRDLIILWTAMSVTRKEMAHMLGATLKSMEYHFKVLRKMGLIDAAAITRYAIKVGMIEP